MSVPTLASRLRTKQYTIRDLAPWSCRAIPYLPASYLTLLFLFFVALGAGAAEPASPPRLVAVKVVDRIGRAVKDPAACLLPGCTKVPLRAEKDGFVAEIPAGAEAVSLRLSARSFEPAEVTVAPEATAVEATLKAKGSIRVAFLAADGKRSERLTVSLKETVDPQAGTRGRLLAERSVTLDPRPAANVVVLEDVPPGDWVLWWEGPSLAAGTKVVRVGETRAEAGTVAVVAGRSVEGAVRDDLGLVVAGARVRLRTGGGLTGRPLGTDRSARSGSDGGFDVSGLPLDEVFSWDVTTPEHEDARGSLGGETRLEVVVRRAQRVSGRLVDEEGLPVADAPFNVSYTTTSVTKNAEGQERRHTNVEGHRERVVSREDGTFSFFRHLPASVQIAPERAGYLPETLVLEPLGDDAERGELDLGDLVLRKGRTLTGSVTAAGTGDPVEGARLDAAWGTGVGGSVGTERSATEADGSYRVDGILPGPEVTLTARRQGFAPRTVKVDPEADSVDLVLGRGGRVEGRVCGTPWEMAAAAVWFGSDGAISNRNQAPVEPSGRFILENAEPGVLTFSRSWRFQDPARPGATFEWGGQVRASVDVKEGETSRLSLGCDGIPLSGVVTRGGRPAASEIVAFSLAGAVATDALTDVSGAFATRVPSPGLWLLSAGGSTTTATASCEVPPGGLDGCRVELTGERGQVLIFYSASAE